MVNSSFSSHNLPPGLVLYEASRRVSQALLWPVCCRIRTHTKPGQHSKPTFIRLLWLLINPASLLSYKCHCILVTAHLSNHTPHPRTSSPSKLACSILLSSNSGRRGLWCNSSKPPECSLRRHHSTSALNMLKSHDKHHLFHISLRSLLILHHCSHSHCLCVSVRVNWTLCYLNGAI